MSANASVIERDTSEVRGTIRTNEVKLTLDAIKSVYYIPDSLVVSEGQPNAMQLQYCSCEPKKSSASACYRGDGPKFKWDQSLAAGASTVTPSGGALARRPVRRTERGARPPPR